MACTNFKYERDEARKTILNQPGNHNFVLKCYVYPEIGG